MKKVFLILVTLMAVTTNKFARNSDTHQMIISSDALGEFRIYMAGSGTISIDWGNGTGIETHSLKDYEPYKWSRTPYYEFRQAYSVASVRTITITGENITHFRCGDILSLDVSKNPALKYLYFGMDILHRSERRGKITSLDVSKNLSLTNLYCHNNQLTSLDVSNNPALIVLACNGNKLMNLDVSNNTALQALYCADNQLTSLDMRNNTALGELDCNNNQLDYDALNTLFETLHENPLEVKVAIIYDNPGTDTCNSIIATNKGWKVRLTEEYLWNPAVR